MHAWVISTCCCQETRPLLQQPTARRHWDAAVETAESTGHQEFPQKPPCASHIDCSRSADIVWYSNSMVAYTAGRESGSIPCTIHGSCKLLQQSSADGVPCISMQLDPARREADDDNAMVCWQDPFSCGHGTHEYHGPISPKNHACALLCLCTVTTT